MIYYLSFPNYWYTQDPQHCESLWGMGGRVPESGRSHILAASSTKSYIPIPVQNSPFAFIVHSFGFYTALMNILIAIWIAIWILRL